MCACEITVNHTSSTSTGRGFGPGKLVYIICHHNTVEYVCTHSHTTQ